MKEVDLSLYRVEPGQLVDLTAIDSDAEVFYEEREMAEIEFGALGRSGRVAVAAL